MKKIKKFNPSSVLVTQSNRLIESRYNLSLAEQRLILSMISRIHPDDKAFKPYIISIHEFAEFLGIDKNSMYRECKKITELLLSRVVKIQEDDGLLQTNWVSSAKYLDGEGVVKLCFDPLLKPYLLQIKSRFTSCRLEMLLSFKSQYTMRFYMLIKQYEKMRVRDIPVDELRKIIGLGANQYKLYNDLKRFIIIPVQKELQEKSDLYFDFEEIKQGRRIGIIRFIVLSKNGIPVSEDETVSENLISEWLGSPIDVEEPQTPPELQNNVSAINRLLKQIPDEHRGKKSIQALIEETLQKNSEAYVERNILYSNEKAEKSYTGFLGQALKEDWAYDWNFERLAKEEQKKAIYKPIWEKLGFKSESDYANYMLKRQIEQIKSAEK
jgi:plasmid replication initiation protein